MNERDEHYMELIKRLPFEQIADHLEGIDLCADCDEIAFDLPGEGSYHHQMIGMFVIIGCGGYWHIDPEIVGIDSPHWMPR